VRWAVDRERIPEGRRIKVDGNIPCRKKPKALQHAYLRRCAAPFVIAAYTKIRLIPQGLRALHLEPFTKPLSADSRDVLFSFNPE